MKKFCRFVGDIHGGVWRPYYNRLTRKATFSIQVGDLCGDSYGFLGEVDPDYHKAIAGNHENYDPHHRYYWRNVPHFLGDFGIHTIPSFPDIFYVRGGFSLNIENKRMENIWYEEEELTVTQLYKAIELYQKTKPNFVVSHECPLSIVPYVSDPAVARYFGYRQDVIKTKTNQALQAMLEIHRPAFWIFGHYHTYFNEVIDNCNFICLNKMPDIGCYLDFNAVVEDIDLTDHLDEDNPFELELGGGG